jgi:hypothetical protein
MRIQSVLVSVAILFNSGFLRADDEPKAIIEKAIKAHGGEENLMKYKAGRMKGKGKAETPGGQLEFTQESAYMMPDKVKEITEFELKGTKYRTVTLINGDKASVEVNGKETPLKDNLKDGIKESVKHLQVTKLVPLREKKFELSLVGDTIVQDKPAVTIRVSAKGMKDVNLSFDKKTNLLVKVEMRKIHPEKGQEVNEERILTDYKIVDGMPVPRRVIVTYDGKAHIEVAVEEMKYLEKLDESEFNK